LQVGPPPPLFLSLPLRDVAHGLRRRQLDSLLHAELDRALVPHLHRGDPGCLARAPLLAAPAPTFADTTRVPDLTGGGVPLQHPPAPRPLSDDPLGRRVPAPLGGGPRRVGRP